MYDFSKVDIAKSDDELTRCRVGVGDVRPNKHSTGDESTKKVGKENAKVVGKKLRQGSEKRYSVSAENSEEILHGNSTPPPNLSTSPTGITDVRQNEQLEVDGIDIDSIPTINRSETSSLLYSGRKKKEDVEIPITDKNFIENFTIETSDELEVDESTHNDLSKGSLLGVDLNELETNLVRARAELCKKDFSFFIKEFWDEVVVEKCIWNWHMDELAQDLQKIAYQVANRRKNEEDLILNITPGTTKSTIVSILFPVYCWIVDPTITFITTAHSQDLTTGQANRSRQLLRSTKFHTYFPNITMKDSQDNKTDYENKNGGFRKAFSVGSSPTGNHALILIMDDPQNPAMADSEVERKNVTEWIGKQLFTRKSNKEVAVTILVQQRLHSQDVTAYLLGLGTNYKHICLPAELNNQVKPAYLAEKYVDGLLDAHRLTRETLEKEKIRLGSKTFMTQYMQSPNDEENAILKEPWFQKISKIEFDALVKKQKPAIDFYLDTAFTPKTNRDPSAILACCRMDNNLYITGAKTVRLEFPKLVQFIKDYTASQGYTTRSKIHIEGHANGISVIQQLRADTALNVIQEKDNKDGKITRLNAISAMVEAGRVFLVEDHWNNVFLTEVTADDPIHDDLRDCFVAAMEGKLSKKGFRTVIR